MRQLATIRKVSNILPIEGKDRIELAIFDGWQVIVKKGEFELGSLAVFVEIDSVLPDRPEFEFLRSKNFRVKTMRMASVISQGIAFLLSILPKGNYNEGDDVTKILGITQYKGTMDLDPIKKETKQRSKLFKYFLRFGWFRKLFGKTKKEKYGFPDFISKTDETRVQNIPHLLGNKDIKYIVTEKVDGSSVTLFLKKLRFGKYDFGVCSRNLRLEKDMTSVYWQVAEKYSIESVLKELIGNNDFAAIQGEIIAPR